MANFVALSALYPLLNSVQFPADLKQLRKSQLPQFCDELRAFIIETVLAHGGHFAANLGVVELTVALHYVFNTPNDRLVWDVGHQAYAHKILTGRKDNFHTNRTLGGISGFPKMDESEYDAFGTGHSSTAISAILGMAAAAKLQGNTARKHIAIVGDGALTAGEAFEGLNNLALSGTNVLVVLNDNNIGIDPNTGAINRHLNQINPEQNLFTDFGLKYCGPWDGHDILHLVEMLEALQNQTEPSVLHIKTIKGKGFEEAEREQTKWHSTPRYVKIEKPHESEPVKNLKYQDVFGKTLKELAQYQPNITGVTPAMPTGSGMLTAMEAFPERFFDVGIAEQHAVTFAAGMAKEGLVVFCSLYSTFLQRALDQVIHDVCIQKLPVIFCIDRAGNVGDDGPTHHGMFDIAMLRPLPNITIVAPSTGNSLRNMMHYFASNLYEAVAIRYPKGNSHGESIDWHLIPVNPEPPQPQMLVEGTQVAILAIGNMVHFCNEAAALLNERQIWPTLYDMQIVKPLPLEFMKSVFETHTLIVTIEDGSVLGGFGDAVLEMANTLGYSGKVVKMGFPDVVVEHGDTAALFAKFGLNAEGICNTVIKNVSE
jgi:1-deoxy-D-xylulose-5-phosphate synthase